MDPARYVGSSEDTSLQVQGQTREQHSAYNMKTGGHFGALFVQNLAYYILLTLSRCMSRCRSHGSTSFEDV